MRHRVQSMRSDQTGRACYTDAEAVDRVGTRSFPGFATRGHAGRPRPVVAIVRRWALP